MASGRTNDDLPSLDLTAGLLAVLVPGLGHVYQGRVRRGLLAGGGVLLLYAIGLLIGGLSVINPGQNLDDKLWYAGQLLVGPVTLVLNHFKTTMTAVAPDADAAPRLIASLGKVAEMGILYTSIAGMMNLIVVLDGLLPRTVGRVPEPATAEPTVEPNSTGPNNNGPSRDEPTASETSGTEPAAASGDQAR